MRNSVLRRRGRPRRQPEKEYEQDNRIRLGALYNSLRVRRHDHCWRIKGPRGGLSGTSCIPISGFYCSSITYSHATGNSLITVGQNPAQWTAWAALFAPTGIPMTANAPAEMFYAEVGTLRSGRADDGKHTCDRAQPKGSRIAGTVWICYTTTVGAKLAASTLGSCKSKDHVSYAQMAMLTASST